VNLSRALVPLLRFLDFYDQNSEEQRENSGRRRCSCIRQTAGDPGFPRL